VSTGWAIPGGQWGCDKGREALLVLDGLGSSDHVLLILEVDFRPGDALSGDVGTKLKRDTCEQSAPILGDYSNVATHYL